jgi:hypothetical protein
MNHFGIFKTKWWCRWCGKQYKPVKEVDRDGFCPCGKCKQAHYRALKRYNEALRSKKDHSSAESDRKSKSNAKRGKK